MPKDKSPDAIRARFVAASSNVVGNKMILFDCLLQCREDYMAAAEHAIDQHKTWRADTSSNVALRVQMLSDFAAIIERSQARLEMIRKAIGELE